MGLVRLFNLCIISSVEFIRLIFQGLALYVSFSIWPSFWPTDTMYLVASPALFITQITGKNPSVSGRKPPLLASSSSGSDSCVSSPSECSLERSRSDQVKGSKTGAPYLHATSLSLFVPAGNGEVPESPGFICCKVTLEFQKEAAMNLTWICFQVN